MFDNKELDDLSLEKLEKNIAKYPQEVQDKVDEILKAFGQFLGEIYAEYCGNLLKEAKERS